MKSKYFIIFSLFVLVSLVFCSTAAAADTIYVNESLFDQVWSGSPTADAKGNLVTWSRDADYILVENINMTNVSGFTPIGKSNSASFIGTFNGQNFTISNLDLTGTANYTGLFGYTNNAVIKNVVLTNVSVNSVHNYTGSLVGYSAGASGVIENCRASGTVVGNNNTGGLIGGSSGGNYSKNQFSGDVTGNSNVGGFSGTSTGNISYSNSSGNVSGDSGVGGFSGTSSGNISYSSSSANVTNASAPSYNFGGFIGHVSGTISECIASGIVYIENGDNVGGFSGSSGHGGRFINCSASGKVTGNDYVGGFAAYLMEGDAADCLATGKVTGNDYVGGFAGVTYGTGIHEYFVTNCSATGDVSGNDKIGGFIGQAWNTTVTSKCFASGNVSGINEVGGFVGSMELNEKILNCYATGDVTGTDKVGGFVGLFETWDWLSGGNPDLIVADMEYCYAVGNVSGSTNVGGFAGTESGNNEGEINYCFYKEDNGGGNNGYAVPMSSADLMKIDTFLNAEKNQTDNAVSSWTISNDAYDLANVWYILENEEYPKFTATYIPPSNNSSGGGSGTGGAVIVPTQNNSTNAPVNNSGENNVSNSGSGDKSNIDDSDSSGYGVEEKQSSWRLYSLIGGFALIVLFGLFIFLYKRNKDDEEN